MLRNPKGFSTGGSSFSKASKGTGKEMGMKEETKEIFFIIILILFPFKSFACYLLCNLPFYLLILVSLIVFKKVLQATSK
jgi:hypothetical protein